MMIRIDLEYNYIFLNIEYLICKNKTNKNNN